MSTTIGADTTFTFTGSIVNVTVGVSGDYIITADGAQGGLTPPTTGGSAGAGGGLGAQVSGDIYLAAGTHLEIVVGGEGGPGGGAGAGGGGGSFVIETFDGATHTTVDDILAVAGGGGGASLVSTGGAGVGGTHGAPGAAGSTLPPSSGTGGIGGAGGAGDHGGVGGVLGAGGGGFTGGPGGLAVGVNGSGGLLVGTNGSVNNTFFGGAGFDTGSGGFGGGGGGGVQAGGGGGGYGGGGGGGGWNTSSLGLGGGGGGGGSFFAANSTDDGSSTTSVTETGGGATAGGNGKITIDAVCFASGTLIRTIQGEVAVEDLSVGDLAVTACGAPRPIMWLGHRKIDRPTPQQMPVRVMAGAFGEGLPARDLWLSPGHAVCVSVVDEVFVPVSELINGSTIARVEVPNVTYWHVELESHDVLLAEGLPCESYMDAGNRAFFGREHGRLGEIDHAGVAESLTRYARPFVNEGPVVEAIRKRLATRNKASKVKLSAA